MPLRCAPLGSGFLNILKNYGKFIVSCLNGNLDLTTNRPVELHPFWNTYCLIIIPIGGTLYINYVTMEIEGAQSLEIITFLENKT